jgi:hypothetical protein
MDLKVRGQIFPLPDYSLLIWTAVHDHKKLFSGGRNDTFQMKCHDVACRGGTFWSWVQGKAN